MKPIYKIMALISMLTPTDYAMDSIPYQESKGSAHYEVGTGGWGRIRGIPPALTSRLQQTTEQGSDRKGLDLTEHSATKNAGADHQVGAATQKLLATFDQVSPLSGEDLRLGALPEPSSTGHFGLVRTQSFAVIPSEQKDVEADYGDADYGDADYGDADSGWLYPNDLFTRPSDRTHSPVTTEIDMNNDFLLGRAAASTFERSGVITPESPVLPHIVQNWIPAGTITVTFTNTNRRETVVWGGRFASDIRTSLPIRRDPPKVFTHLTPVNQVPRSLMHSAIRSEENRLPEAEQNSMFPIKFRYNPLTKEIQIKVTGLLKKSRRPRLEHNEESAP